MAEKHLLENIEELPEELLRNSLLLFADEDEEITGQAAAPSATQPDPLPAPLAGVAAGGLSVLEEKPPLTYHQEVKREIAGYLQQRHAVVDRVLMALRRKKGRESIRHRRRPPNRPALHIPRHTFPCRQQLELQTDRPEQRQTFQKTSPLLGARERRTNAGTAAPERFLPESTLISVKSNPKPQALHSATLHSKTVLGKEPRSQIVPCGSMLHLSTESHQASRARCREQDRRHPPALPHPLPFSDRSRAVSGMVMVERPRSMVSHLPMPIDVKHEKPGRLNRFSMELADE